MGYKKDLTYICLNSPLAKGKLLDCSRILQTSVFLAICYTQQMKTKYILHGGYTREPNESNESFFYEMVKSVPNNGRVLLVYFASDDSKVDNKYIEDCERMKLYEGDKNISFIKATHEDFLVQVEKADVIYLRGGDTQKLQNILAEYQNFSDSIKGKTMAGSSAGAYVLSKYYFTNSLNKVLEGLGCLPVRCICHFESKIHPASDDVDSVSMMEEFDSNLELVLLKDYEWRVFNT